MTEYNSLHTLCQLIFFAISVVLSLPFLYYFPFSICSLIKFYILCLKTSICKIEIVTGQLKKSENHLALLLERRNRLRSIKYVSGYLRKDIEAIKLLSYKNVAYAFFPSQIHWGEIWYIQIQLNMYFSDFWESIQFKANKPWNKMQTHR